MIYRNDNIIEKDEYVKGTLKDLKTYFRYKIASLCMSGEDEIEGFTSDVREILDLIDNLDEDIGNKLYSENDIVYVYKRPMENYYITSEEE